MLRILDTDSALPAAYEGGAFCFERWKAYMDAALPGLAPLLLSDARGALASGELSWSEDYLPVLNAVARNPDRRREAHESFRSATENLNQIVFETFGREIDADVIFYLGLCNGAGWATTYRGRRAVLLGVEKILELNWCGADDMRGLIFHELGHIYQGQYGAPERSFDSDSDSLLWQLFTEGVAMCFEQALAGDPDFYHQDKGGWKRWCDAHFAQIKLDFRRDLQTMTPKRQRYFGDWVQYDGHGDVGYYLGCRFVRALLEECSFDDVIRLDIEAVKERFARFLA